ncbi:GNAT family N-acetyltransferase [Salipaludibacillus daqingensis]|uniref:GNAT family N-acetyltransferase n=1 Tax=Salipaludibacillus daqingensis TaxID=3041001 RepID=UPI0024761B31|nr:GNAT family protein [Salipaludibacillus daqingensis]
MFKVTIDKKTYIALLEERHAEELYHLIDENRLSLGEWLHFPAATTKIQDTREFIEKSLNRFASNNGYWAGIWHKGKLAGSIGYLYIDLSNNKTEIGYWLGENYQGIGLATQASKLLIEHAFNNLQLNKVEINVATENLKSKALPERLGFKKEGEIRDYEKLNGKYFNRIIYGLLKDEWLNKESY